MMIYMAVTDFDACEYDFWKMILTRGQITYCWSQMVTISTFENNAYNFLQNRV